MSEAKSLYLEVIRGQRQWEAPMQALCHAMKNLIKNMDQEDPNVKVVSHQIKVAEDNFTTSKNSAFLTFSGEGAIATYLSQRIISRIADNGGIIAEKDNEDLKKLEDYDLCPISKVTATAEIYTCLAQFDPIVDGRETRVPVRGGVEDLADLLNMTTGLYRVMNGEDDLLVLNINEKSSTDPNLRYLIQIAPSSTYICHAFHELENYMAPISTDLYFSSMPHDIDVIAQELFSEYKLNESRDFASEFIKLKEKAQELFENQEYLGLINESVDKTNIVLNSNNYNFVYRCSDLGDKKFVTASIEVDVSAATKFGTSVRYNDIPKDKIETVFNDVTLQMGRMLDVIAYNKKAFNNMQ